MMAGYEMEKTVLTGKTHSIRELLNIYGIRLSKSMGQNFLIDANIPEKIIKLSGIDKSCLVLEVGPGLGALTSELCKTAGYVITVELDKRLMPLLTEKYSGQKNVEIIQGDILRLDIGNLINDSKNRMQYHVCANLPYNITSPAITAFIDAGVFNSITVMVQKEVALRICAKPGSPEYGAFSVYSNYYTIPEILFDVPPECFLPRPKVVSTVVKMKTREERLLTEEKEKTFFRVVRAAFGQRRKTLANALLPAFEKTYNKDEIKEIILKCGFDVNVRGEVLSIDDFISICNYL